MTRDEKATALRDLGVVLNKHNMGLTALNTDEVALATLPMYDPDSDTIMEDYIIESVECFTAADALTHQTGESHD